jgi:hypothetical protein
MKALWLGCSDMEQGKGLAGALDNTSQDFRQKFLPSRQVQTCAESGCNNRNIHILSGSQATIKALDNYCINTKLVLDCHQSLIKLAEHNTVPSTQVPSHRGTEGNETLDQLTKLGLCPLHLLKCSTYTKEM